MNYNIALKEAKPSGNRVFHMVMSEELYNLFNEELKKKQIKQTILNLSQIRNIVSK